MCNPVQSIVDVIVDNIVKTVFKSVGRHVGFLFHYKQNVKNLEDEKNNLQQQRSNVQEKVDHAEHRGEAIDNNVSGWLQDADKASQGVDTFMDEKVVKENMMCFNFSCPDFISNYRLSKQAKNKAVSIKQLAEKGSEIGTVSHPREDPPELELPSSRDYEDFHSRQKVFKDIVEALKDSNVNMIGVYGTGGVGKTTMVEKVGKQLKEDGTFDQVVMAVVSKDANVKNIQGQLADALDIKLEGETEVRRAKQLWKRLDNEKNNLIILDDVWQELDLKKIGIPIKAGNKRCKVVLTSRNRDVWKNMDVDVDFHVEFLTEEEAWTLFKKKVGNHVDSHDQPRRDIAWAICKECQGLPVAINAIGAALKGKDMHAWKNALHKLKNSMLKDIVGIDQKVYASLKWSYDQLESEDAKSCFLLCCLFAEDAEISIDDLVRYYIAWRTLHRYQMLATLEEAFDQVCTVINALKSCCLLLDGESKHLVKMHDVVRDIAISIAEDEKSFLVKHGFKDWLEKAAYEHCSMISLRPDDVHKFPDKLVCPELHTLRIDCAINSSQLDVPDEFFIGTGNLMVLDLEGVIMSPLLPTSLAKLAKLQMLCLNQCDLGDISILKDLKDHLEILSLRGSNIEVLPPEVGELTRLRLLDMSDCHKLQMIPKGVISKLFRLEELHMPLSFGKWEGTTDERETSNASLDELMSLTRLTTLQIWISNAALLPKDLSFEKLVRFDIIICEELEDYRVRDFGRRGYTRPLTGMLALKNFHVANNLEFLLGKPKRSIPRNGLYPYLIDLSIKHCGMKYLFSPSCARELVGLQCLTIEDCGVMEGVIETEKDKDEDILIIFSGLKTLYLGNLPSLISFYPTMEKTATSSGSSSGHAKTVLFNDKVEFPVLEELHIFRLPNITDIWDKKLRPAESFCPLLRELDVSYCDELVNVVRSNMLPQLRNLRRLSLTSCPSMEVIVDLEKREEEAQGAANNNTIIPFPELTEMLLGCLPNIKSFCSFRSGEQPVFNAQVAFPKLENLFLNSLGEIALQQLLGAFEQLSLKRLRLYKCDEVSTMSSPHFLRSLRNVGLLEVTKCEGVREVFHFDGLEVGDGQECVGRPSLIQVRIVQLDDLPQLTCLWNKDPRVLLDLQNLEYLTIKNCPLLANLFTASVAKALAGLKGLCLRSCSRMEEVITTDEKGHKDAIDDDDEIVFPELERLILENLPNLKSFCGSNHNLNFPSLRRVVLRWCPEVQTFTSGSVRMPQIRLTTSGSDDLVIEDLNKRLEYFFFLKGDQVIIWGISEMDDDKDFYYYNLKYWLPYSRLDESFRGVAGVGMSRVR